MKDVRKIYTEFMKSKGHHEIPNVSLIPENDSSLLFVNSGMFPLVPYLTGQVEPPSKRLFNIQRCARFNGRDDDISEVGDSRHASFFHMIGNWSIGDYFKETQIPQIFELLVEKLEIDINKLYVTVFEGNNDAPRDNESIEIWKQVYKKYGIYAEVSETLVDYSDGEKVIAKDGWSAGRNPNERIFLYPYKKNWWLRGEAVGELGGPDSEMFYDTGLKHDPKFGEVCHVNCDCGRFLEIGNNVFMQYIKNDKGGWDLLNQKNVDFGGGLERLMMAVMGVDDMFKTSDFWPIIEKLQDITGKKYDEQENKIQRSWQVIADHMRAAVFSIGDGVLPSNKDAGYCIRRLIRRAVRFARRLGIENNFSEEIVNVVVDMFKEYYPHLDSERQTIIDEISKEEKKFSNTIKSGLKELNKLVDVGSVITAENIFNLYQTYGFPLEMSVEEIQNIEAEKGREFDAKKILQETIDLINHHKEISKAGAVKKFKGGLADTQEETTRLHTAAHLFLEAARRILGDHVHQRGSNITSERLRFDISHPEKITPEQIKQIEDIVNEAIDKEYDRTIIELSTPEAFRLGAEGEFGHKYGDNVSVYKFFRNADTHQYSVGVTEAIEKDKSIESEFNNEEVYSFEICGGPHVINTRELKKSGHFKITKEESVSAGVRRVKGILE